MMNRRCRKSCIEKAAHQPSWALWRPTFQGCSLGRIESFHRASHYPPWSSPAQYWALQSSPPIALLPKNRNIVRNSPPRKSMMCLRKCSIFSMAAYGWWLYFFCFSKASSESITLTAYHLEHGALILVKRGMLLVCNLISRKINRITHKEFLEHLMLPTKNIRLWPYYKR